MTDREMLEICLDAFKVIPVADKSRKFLKDYLGVTAGAYAGNRSHILADEMVRRLQKHLGKSHP